MADSHSTHPTRLTNLSVEVDFEDLTWGDLRAFVRLAADLPDGEPVALARDIACDVQGLRIGHLPAGGECTS